MRIVRPRRCFRMVLHAEQRQVAMPQSLQRAVIQIDMRLDDLTVRERIWVNGKVMIVRRDLHLLRLQLLHRMIAAVVSELELVCLAAERQADQLMSETNPE